MDQGGLYKRWRWCFALMSCLSMWTVSAHAETSLDILGWSDDFGDATGLNITTVSNFNVSGGGLTATGTPAVAQSNCITLPEPVGTTRQKYAFFELVSQNWAAGATGEVIIETCGGGSELARFSLNGSCDVFAEPLAATDNGFQVRFELTDAVGTQLDSYRLVTEVDGWLDISAEPAVSTFVPPANVNFSIGLGVSHADLPAGVELKVDLGAANHDPTLVEDGWMELDTNDYPTAPVGGEYARPVAVNTAGQFGATAADITGAAPEEIVSWDVGGLQGGASQQALLELAVPEGYFHV